MIEYIIVGVIILFTVLLLLLGLIKNIRQGLSCRCCRCRQKEVCNMSPFLTTLTTLPEEFEE